VAFGSFRYLPRAGFFPFCDLLTCGMPLTSAVLSQYTRVTTDDRQTADRQTTSYANCNVPLKIVDNRTYISEPAVGVRWPRLASCRSVHRCIPPASTLQRFHRLSRVFPFHCTLNNNHIRTLILLTKQRQPFLALFTSRPSTV